MTARHSHRERPLPPLMLSWHELPLRVIHGSKQQRRPAWFQQHSAAHSGPTQQPFDLCAHVRTLLADIVERCPEYRHLQVPRILVSVTQSRGNGAHGLQARVTPLRFRQGQLIRQRRGVPFHIQRYFLGEQEFLYLLTFCVPRYLNADFDQKIVTLFHELHHIGPAFDGDLRRHDGRYQFHTHSQRDYDRHMVEHARSYLATRPEPSVYGFLRMDFAQPCKSHGTVTGVVVPRPKMIPLIGPYAAAAACQGIVP